MSIDNLDTRRNNYDVYSQAQANGGSIKIGEVLYVVFNDDFGRSVKIPLKGIWIEVFNSSDRILEKGGYVYSISNAGKMVKIDKAGCEFETE